MPRKGHGEEKIIFALRQVEGGKKVSEVCRRWGYRHRHSTVGNDVMLAWA
jgi:hypothetical protein